MTYKKQGIIASVSLLLSSLLIVSVYTKDTCPIKRQNTSSIIELRSTSQFDDLINPQSGNVVVKFFATWCPPCKLLSKTIHDTLAPQYAGRVRFVEVDIDRFPTIQKKYKVTSFPTLIYFKNGKKIYSSSGNDKAGKISADLDRQFNV